MRSEIASLSPCGPARRLFSPAPPVFSISLPGLALDPTHTHNPVINTCSSVSVMNTHIWRHLQRTAVRITNTCGVSLTALQHHLHIESFCFHHIEKVFEVITHLHVLYRQTLLNEMWKHISKLHTQSKMAFATLTFEMPWDLDNLKGIIFCLKVSFSRLSWL